MASMQRKWRKRQRRMAAAGGDNVRDNLRDASSDVFPVAKLPPYCVVYQ